MPDSGRPCKRMGRRVTRSDPPVRARPETPFYIRPFIEQKSEQCAAVITVLAEAGPGAVLFHCGAGRDRTGVVALLLLALADVEAIASDYTASVAHLTPVFERLGRPDEGPIIERLLERQGTTAREVILDVLRAVDVAGVLLSAGVAPEDVQRLRAQLVAVPQRGN